MTASFFWKVMQCGSVDGYRLFGTKYPSHIQRSNSSRRPLQLGSIGFPESSVTTNPLCVQSLKNENLDIHIKYRMQKNSYIITITQKLSTILIIICYKRDGQTFLKFNQCRMVNTAKSGATRTTWDDAMLLFTSDRRGRNQGQGTRSPRKHDRSASWKT
jgi:hypothetical protein